jgi:putative endopeptidase
LQPPFFDATADIAANLGGIGAVIGHELTHGFDDQGCQFDADGNVRIWQTDNDREVFAARADIIIKQAGAYEVLPGLHMQGDLVIGESIADLGGVEIAFEALEQYLAEHPGENIDGLTPQQRFFIAGAASERDANRDEKKREYALTDPHPDSVFRVNGVLQHVDGFYKAFGVTKKDALFRPAEARAKIW